MYLSSHLKNHLNGTGADPHTNCGNLLLNKEVQSSGKIEEAGRYYIDERARESLYYHLSIVFIASGLLCFLPDSPYMTMVKASLHVGFQYIFILLNCNHDCYEGQEDQVY